MMKYIHWWIENWKQIYQNPKMESWLIYAIHSSWY